MRRVILAAAGFAVMAALGCGGGPKDQPVTDLNKPIAKPKVAGDTGGGPKNKAAAIN